MSFEKQLFVGSVLLMAILGTAVALIKPVGGGGGGFNLAVTPAHATTDESGTATLTAVVSGGTASTSTFTYQWYNETNPNNVYAIAGSSGTGKSLTVKGGDVGNFLFYVVAEDAHGDIDVSSSAEVTIVPNPLPLVVGLAPSSATTTLYSSVMLTVSISGGTAPYAINWYNDTSGTPVLMSKIANSLTYNFQSNGNLNTYRYYVSVVDSSLTPQSSTSSISSITVSSYIAATISPENVVTTAGNSVTLTAEVQSNDPKYAGNIAYTWTNATSQLCASTKMATCTFNAPGGLETVTVRVTDENDGLSNTFSTTVNGITTGNSGPEFMPISAETNVTYPASTDLNASNGSGIMASLILLQRDVGGDITFAVGGTNSILIYPVYFSPVNMSAYDSFIYSGNIADDYYFDPGNSYAVNTYAISGAPWALVKSSLDGAPTNILNVSSQNTVGNFTIRLASVGSNPFAPSLPGAVLEVYHNNVLISPQCIPASDYCFFAIGSQETFSAGPDTITINVSQISPVWAQVQLFRVIGGSQPSGISASPSAKVFNTNQACSNTITEGKIRICII